MRSWVFCGQTTDTSPLDMGGQQRATLENAVKVWAAGQLEGRITNKQNDTLGGCRFVEFFASGSFGGGKREQSDLRKQATVPLLQRQEQVFDTQQP